MMLEPLPQPGDYASLDDVFGGLAALDRVILELLAQRFGLVRSAARMDPALFALADEERRRETIANARRAAFELGIPVGLVGEFFDRLLDASLASARQAARDAG